MEEENLNWKSFKLSSGDNNTDTNVENHSLQWGDSAKNKILLCYCNGKISFVFLGKSFRACQNKKDMSSPYKT